MTDRGLAGHPTWLRDIDSALTVTPSFVLHGNLRDRYIIPCADGDWQPMDMHQALWDMLRRSGYSGLVRHTPTCLQIIADDSAARDRVTRALSLRDSDANRPMGPDRLAALMGAVMDSQEIRLALTIDYVSQWRPIGQPSTDPEHALMQAALALVHDAYPKMIGHERPVGLYNPVLWVVDRPADLPPWLAGGSDGIRQISVPRPDLDSRQSMAEKLLPTLDPYAQGSAEPKASAVRFAEQAEGMSLNAMISTVQLARDRALGPDRIEDAVRAYRVGLIENPWSRPALQERIKNGEAFLSGAVKGQERAVRHALDILIRSTTGMTGAERGGDATGPRGILFLAGPTGVGKTELAKQITSLVFGQPNAYVRFDMSEFASEHTEARLIGSPPGYVGHGEGGELTNAVRQRPFCLVLFDEIEKAHPRILDKFLQILSDGRLSDGSGDTVYFGETIIVFTSNLGVPDLDANQAVPTGSLLENTVRRAIEHEFEVTIKRPELLGRIGDNIVVFDYIDPRTAEELAGVFLDNVLTHATARTGVGLTIAPGVREEVVRLVTADLSKGGRGIARAVESTLVNPLARALFAWPGGQRTATISGLERREGGWYATTLS